jgi:hypothetical protein
MKTGKQKSEDIYLACRDYHKWNSRNKHRFDIESFNNKVKKCHDLEKKYSIRKDGLIKILRLDEYRGNKVDSGNVEGRNRSKSNGNQAEHDH